MKVVVGGQCAASVQSVTYRTDSICYATPRTVEWVGAKCLI
jgi:hypothetical protein